MSNKLIDERPLLVLPTLAKKIGLNRAIALQQLQFWLHNTQTDRSKRKTHFFDGRWWVYNTYQFWQEDSFTWWKTRTIRYIFTSLEEDGLVERRPHKNNNLGYWHTINYDAVDKLMGAENELNPDLIDDDTPAKSCQGSENDTPDNSCQGLEGTSDKSCRGTPDKSCHHSETTYTETTKTETNINRPAAVPAVFDPNDQLTESQEGGEEAEASNFNADHPLVKVLRKFNHGKAIPSKIARTLEKPIQIRREEGTTKYPSLLFCYDEWAGFPDFVESRVGQFIEAGKGDLKGVVGNLRNFDKTDTSFYGWFKWKEENKRFINRESEPEKPEVEYVEWMGDY